MQVIKDYETFSNFYKNCYKWVENYSNEKQEKYITDSFKSYLMIKTDDDYIILLSKKPTIDSDLWYDDETPAPDVTLDYFKDYNKMNFKYNFDEYLKNKEELKTRGVCSGLYSQKLLLIGEKGKNCGVSCIQREKEYSYFIRELTDEEEQQFLSICNDLKNEYDERLTKYFNRYRKCIHARGYWVNR